MTDKIRVRFAPSPTGFLHIGGARTALYNYLFTRRHNGKFIFRIEDTDQTRSTDEYIEAIIDGMKWLGLSWDEGPFRQTQRQDVYLSHVQKLLEQGKAYYCYCSADVLEKKRELAMTQKRPPGYDGTCRELKNPPTDAVNPVVRFKMPTVGETTVSDLIRGNVTFNNNTLDDFIILRSDGMPTYNFVVVIDDIDMGITHVIRGDDHLNNTPKQIQIYQALGCPVPLFAHLPMILGADKKRLSKRHGAVSVSAYRDMGYLPEALLNYLVRLGWSHGDQEVFTMQEMIDAFALDKVGSSSTVFNPEKLLWINAEHIKKHSPEELIPLVMPFLIEQCIVGSEYSPDIDWLSKAIATLIERSRTLVELAHSLRYYISDDIKIDETAGKKFLNNDTLPLLNSVITSLKELKDFSAASIEKLFIDLMAKHDVKLGKLAQPIRVALTGNTVSPGIYEVLELLGKEISINRIQKAINSISNSE
ncbi:MAG: glutamate--tRNA ligase [Nitrospirae bacterium]|nr:glutamate--tRNA ligase [Nitrospirota bacterium]